MEPHLGDNWETTSGKEVEDNETTTRPGANIWETKSRNLGDNLRDHMWEIGQRQQNNNRTGKQQLGTTSGRQHGDNWETTSGRQHGDNRETTSAKDLENNSKPPDCETTSRKPHLGDNWETTSGRQVED